MGILIWNKKFLVLAWVMCFSFLYFVMVAMIITEHTKFYTESQWMPMALFFAIPAIYYSHYFSKNKIQVFTLVLFSLWFINMIPSYKTFKNRFDWQMSILHKMNNKGIDKLILTNVNKDVEKSLQMTWGLPVESLFLSQTKFEKQMTFLINQSERNKGKANTYLSCFEELPISRINNNYCTLDTNTVYKVVPYKDF